MPLSIYHFILSTSLSKIAYFLMNVSWFDEIKIFIWQNKMSPFSSLSHMSKVFEWIILNQINEYIKPFSSNLLGGFRKNHNTQKNGENARKMQKSLINWCCLHGSLKSIRHPKPRPTYSKTSSLLTFYNFPKIYSQLLTPTFEQV